MQSTGQASTHAVSFVPMQGSAMIYAMGHLRCLSPYAFHKKDSSVTEVDSWRMEPTIEKISAVTLRVANMMKSVRFYRDVLGMELLYGGEDAGFSSLRAKDAQSAFSIWNRATR
jgi:catechol-2,3-dioxygenase